jgi:hypothetical protein
LLLEVDAIELVLALVLVLALALVGLGLVVVGEHRHAKVCELESAVVDCAIGLSRL